MRTLQRRVKVWRATEGPAGEVFFAQQHPPGRLGASDLTHMEELGVTIQGQSFAHLLYSYRMEQASKTRDPASESSEAN